MNLDQPHPVQGTRRASEILPSCEAIRQQARLPFKKTVEFTIRNIRVRLGRSLPGDQRYRSSRCVFGLCALFRRDRP